MNPPLRIVASLAAAVVLAACAGESSAPRPPDLSRFEQKISYIFGREIGQGLRESPVAVDLDAFLQGLRDAMAQSASRLGDEEEQQTRIAFSARMQEEQARRLIALAEKNAREEAEFLERNRSAPGVLTTASGLQIQVLREGSGNAPRATDRVRVHYRGSLLDGTEFDSSYAREEPAVFDLSGVIPGWAEGLQQMKPGGKYRLWIPSKLAYGVEGAGRAIGPNALLVFEVEPIEVLK